MTALSSRERLLAAIVGAPGAPTPCCFMIFRALRAKCRDECQFAVRQQEMGLDARVQLDDLAIRFSPEVSVREWVDLAPDGKSRLLHRVYETPAGAIAATARQTPDWPHGDRLPIFDDYFTPRAIEYPLSAPAQLDALRYLLAEPTADDIVAFRSQAQARAQFAAEHGMLLTGGWKSQRCVAHEDQGLIGDDGGTGTVVDALMWLCGGTAPLLWAYDDPDYLRQVIGVLEAWNRRRLEIHLEVGVDLVVRRAWYEGTDFWSPALYRRFILPGLKREVEMTHQAGARYGYIITSGMMAIAEALLESGADVLIGVDPGQGKGTTLQQVVKCFGGPSTLRPAQGRPEQRRGATSSGPPQVYPPEAGAGGPSRAESRGGRIGLWGGVSGPLTVESGAEKEVRRAVEEAMNTLGATGRFILSPVDNVREDSERAWRNVRVFIDTWKSLTGSRG